MVCMSLDNNAWIWKDVVSFVLMDRDQRSSHATCIVGASGIGKTFKMQELVTAHGWDAYWIHSSNCSNAKELRDMVEKGAKTNLLANLAQSTAPKVVIIDEIDVFAQMERSFLTTLSDVLLQFGKSKCAIVLLGNSSMEKKLNGIKASIDVYHCTVASPTDMFLWCKERAPKGIKKTQIMEIAEACSGNPGTALQMMSAKACAIAMTSTKREVDSRTSLRNKIQDDPWLYPLRFHENLIKEIAKKKGTKIQKRQCYQELLKMFMEWDVMMTKCQHECDGDNSLAIEHMCNAIITVLSKLEDKKTLSSKTEDQEDFTKLFSNLSLQKKQERNLYTTGLDYPWAHAQIFCDYSKYK